MLIRFVVSNFLSFSEETEFNMLTGSVRRKKDHEYHFGDLSLLKTAAIYGANGAGKSNLVKAIALLQKIVTTGKWNYFTNIQTFRLNPDYAEKPTSFEIEFVMEGKSYSYGLSLFQNIIAEEWLYLTHFGKEDELVFNRRTLQDGETKIEVNDRYFQSAEDKLRIKLYEEELLSNNMPLIKQLGEARQVFEDIKLVNRWFRLHLMVIVPSAKSSSMIDFFTVEHFMEFTNDFIKLLNTGINNLIIETHPIDDFFGENDKEEANRVRKAVLAQQKKQGVALRLTNNNFEELMAVQEGGGNVVIKRLIAKHDNKNGQSFDFLFIEESDGTKRLLELSPLFYTYWYFPFTIIIDEIGRSIHPYLLKKLLSKLIDNQETKGQLILTTHESHLLDQEIFRQDEIWFTEKNKSGATSLYPLSDFKIRFDLDIRKGYLNGRFGAIPFLADLENLKWNDYAKEEAGL